MADFIYHFQIGSRADYYKLLHKAVRFARMHYFVVVVRQANPRFTDLCSNHKIEVGLSMKRVPSRKTNIQKVTRK